MATKLTVLCRGYMPHTVTIEHVRHLLTCKHAILGNVDVDKVKDIPSETEFLTISPCGHCGGRSYFDLSRFVVEPELWSMGNDAAMLPTAMIVRPELAESLGMRQQQRKRQRSARR